MASLPSEPQMRNNLLMADQDGHLREVPVGRHQAFEGRLLHVYVDTVKLPGGQEASREVVVHPGAVAVVATDGHGHVLLVRQWRHAAGRALWEIPAGTREPGEEPRATARRELTEETGYAADTWVELATGSVSPGYSSEQIWFYSATGLHPGSSRPDADELMDVHLFAPAEVARLAADGDVDLKTLAGLALAGVPLQGLDG